MSLITAIGADHVKTKQNTPKKKKRKKKEKKKKGDVFQSQESFCEAASLGERQKVRLLCLQVGMGKMVSILQHFRPSDVS